MTDIITDEQLFRLKQAIHRISGGDFDATDDEVRQIALATSEARAAPQQAHSWEEEQARFFGVAAEDIPPPVPAREQEDSPTLQSRIAELIEQHGSLRAVGRVLDCDAGYLCRLQSGEKKDPNDLLLRRMGLRQIVTYERTKP
jgi:hypothetical protein